jgi:hypothetical protein
VSLDRPSKPTPFGDADHIHSICRPGFLDRGFLNLGSTLSLRPALYLRGFLDIFASRGLNPAPKDGHGDDVALLRDLVWLDPKLAEITQRGYALKSPPVRMLVIRLELAQVS